MNMCETPAPESGVLVFFIFPFVLNFILWSPLLELTLVHMYIISFFFLLWGILKKNILGLETTSAFPFLFLQFQKHHE